MIDSSPTLNRVASNDSTPMQGALSTGADLGGKHSSVSNSTPQETVPQTPVIHNDESVEQHEVMAFVDDTPKASVEFQPISDPTFSHDMLPSQELADFLARPVKVKTYTWTQGVSTFDAVSIWSAFLNNAAIKRKIDNFAFLQGQLHVKVLVNASPFYSGALLISYRPLVNFSKTIDSSNEDMANILFSQRPHVYVLPQTNQGGEMTLPFYYHKNWLDITSALDVGNMGRIDIRPVVGLESANGVTNEALNVVFYAWMTDVKLCGPTVNLAIQAPMAQPNDEYGQGAVSRVATAVANVASKLTEVPYIGVFAKATEIGSSAISKVATLFGFTNVPVISDVMPYKNLPFHSLASANIGEPVAKLTLDPKNELCIDPRTTGLGVGDELAISYLVQKESLLSTVKWTTALSESDVLFYARVSPSLFKKNIVAGQSSYALTPMSMVSHLFTYWRGDIIFRIKCICTKYHKGRVRITWDPIANIGLASNNDSETTSFNKVVDISPDLDMELRCSYIQARHFQTTRKIPVEQSFLESDGVTPVDSSSLSPSTFFDNGSLSIRVMNDLSSPVASSSVSFLIYVRGADNLEFMDPYSNFDARLSHFAPQAGPAMWNTPEDEHCIQTGATTSMPDDQYLVYGGEAIGSLRTIFRRSYADASIVSTDNGGTSALRIVTLNQNLMPLSPGYDPKGPHRAEIQAGGGGVNYSYVLFNPITWIMPSFVSYRGSMMYHYNMDTTSKTRQAMSFLAERRDEGVPLNGTGGLQQITNSDISGSTTAYSARPRFLATSTSAGTGGVALTNTLSQAGLSVAYPMYIPYRFASANNDHYAIGFGDDETQFKRNVLNIIVKPALDSENMTAIVVEKKVSIGTDFNAFFFLNTPMVYEYATYPAVGTG